MRIRRRRKKKGCCLYQLLLLLLLSIGLIYGWNKLSTLLPIGTGYAAKYLCSCNNLTDRTIQDIIENDLDIFPMQYAKTGIIEDEAISSIAGMFAQRASYDEDLGCVLQFADYDEVDVTIPEYQLPNQDNIPWPNGNLIEAYQEIKHPHLETILDEAFEENLKQEKNTRAVIVLKNGKVIAERYAPGFHQNTRLIGWSMTKTITGVLTGILVKQGKLDISKKGLIPEWNDDDRKNITLDHLLRMSSGLEWEESYGSETDVTRMLYKQPDMFKYAASKSQEFVPDTHWEYSSGTSNILSGFIRQTIGNDEVYWRFPFEELLYKIGMYSTIMETDAAGNFVGSSYTFATARDWSRFGLLLSQNGRWYSGSPEDSLGTEIVTKDWIEYMRTPTKDAVMGEYGAQTWLNYGEKGNEENRLFPDCPRDLFYCGGFKGQYVIVVPSEDLVIVRLGHSNPGVFDVNEFVRSVINATHE